MTLQGLRSRSPVVRCVAPGSSQTDSAAAQARAPRVPRPRDQQARPGDAAQVAGVLEDADLDLRVETAPGVVVVLRGLLAVRLRRLAHGGLPLLPMRREGSVASRVSRPSGRN